MSDLNIQLPDGPALLYVSSPSTLLLNHERETTVYRVDSGQISEGGPLSKEDAMRERAILRALLVHALLILDEGPIG